MTLATRVFVFVSCVLALAAFCAPASAQFMYIDVNGDGINDTSDMITVGTDHVDLYLVTDKNADGSPVNVANCGDGALTINSYEIILRAFGRFTPGAWTDNMSFPVSLGTAQAGTDFYVGRGSAVFLPPGKYKLGSLAVSNAENGAGLFVVAFSSVSPTAETAFGSQCVGLDFDNTLKLGSDWTDTAGTNTGDWFPPLPPMIDVSPIAHDFGRVNVGAESEPFAFYISNSAQNGYFHISSITVSGPDWILSESPQQVTYSDPLVVTFKPLSGGPKSAVITINNDSYNNQHFTINVSGVGNTAPTIGPIGDKSGFAFVNLAFDVSANDPEGDGLVFGITGKPPGATFDTDSGHFSWTPGASDAGNYPVTFSASDGLTSASEAIHIAITASNSPPVADPRGPYTGATGQPIVFDGSGSSDPDGDALQYGWSFGDGGSATGATASHSFLSAGSYLVSLTVNDSGTPSLSDAATTSAFVLDLIPAQVNLKLPTSGTMRVSGGGNQLIGLETTSVPATVIDPLSIRVSTTQASAGTAREIRPSAGKDVSLGDVDGDNVPDLVASFSRASLHDLLGNVANNTMVTLVVNAITTAGMPIQGSATVRVKNGGSSAVSAFAAPNPFNPIVSVSWTLRAAGAATVRIYSLDGRLVKVLHEGPSPAGTSTTSWNGVDSEGRSVSAGTYFLVAQSAGEKAVQKLYLVK